MTRFLDQTSLLVVTCIHEKCEQFALRILAFLSRDPGSKWSVKRSPLELTRIYSGSPPYGGDLLHAVLWTPRTMPDWTAFVVNSRDGRSHLFRKLSHAGGGPETVSIRSTVPGEEDGVQEFEFRAANSNEYWPTRLIQWLREGGRREAANSGITPSGDQSPIKETGFRLAQKGESLPFEFGMRVEKPIPQPTRPALLEFVRKFGIDLENEEFWKSEYGAIYLDQTRLTRANDL